MQLSIIIPAHKSGNEIDFLLESIIDQKTPPEYEVLVIANPPQPLLRQKIASKPKNFRYLETKSIGVNYARNVGLKDSRGEIVLFIDDDCLLHDPHFLKKHYDKHLAFPQLDGLGGYYTITNSAGPIEQSYHIKQMEWVQNGLQPSYHVELLLGGNMSFKKINISGLFFDEKIKFGGAETEFIYHLASKGKRTRIFHELSILHKTKIHLRDFFKKALLQGAGAAYLKRKKYQKDNSVIRAYSTKENLNSKKIKLLLNFYEIFFLSGYFLKEYGLSLNGINVVLATFFILFKKITLFIKHFIFVDLWCAIEAALFSRRNNTQSKNKKVAK